MRMQLLIVLILSLSLQVGGQQQSFSGNGNSSPDNKNNISGLVNQLPAENTAALDLVMSELAGYGGEAIMTIAGGLVSPGKGDDTKRRFAISGIVKYVSLDDDPYHRLQISYALCEAIDAAGDDEVKDFLLQELQYIAGDEAVLTVAPYLSNPRLTDPAARVLINIDSEASKGALLEQLSSAVMPVKTDLVQALGYTRYKPATQYIRELAITTDDVELRGVSLHALAETGGMETAGILSEAAREAGYDFEPTRATSSWLLFIERVAEEGNISFAEDMLDEAVRNNNIPAHTLALINDLRNRLAAYYYFIPGKEELNNGFVPLFNGIDLTGWTGNKSDYSANRGRIVCQPTGSGHGNLYTEKEYSDFILRFEFKLTPGANNGLGIRTPLTGDAAYVGMELQILDNKADRYKNLADYQYHGSVYGVIPAKRGHLKPVGEWNYQEVYANGTHLKIILNGSTILDGDIAKASNNGTKTIDNRDHPGLLNESGHIGFLGHGSHVEFRNLRIKELK